MAQRDVVREVVRNRLQVPTLTERQVRVLKRYYGIDSPRYNFREIGESEEVSGAAIKSVRDKAFAKIHRADPEFSQALLTASEGSYKDLQVVHELARLLLDYSLMKRVEEARHHCFLSR